MKRNNGEDSRVIFGVEFSFPKGAPYIWFINI